MVEYNGKRIKMFLYERCPPMSNGGWGTAATTELPLEEYADNDNPLYTTGAPQELLDRSVCTMGKITGHPTVPSLTDLTDSAGRIPAAPGDPP